MSSLSVLSLCPPQHLLCQLFVPARVVHQVSSLVSVSVVIVPIHVSVGLSHSLYLSVCFVCFLFYSDSLSSCVHLVQFCLPVSSFRLCSAVFPPVASSLLFPCKYLMSAPRSVPCRVLLRFSGCVFYLLV